MIDIVRDPYGNPLRRNDEITRLRNELHIAQEWSSQVIAGREQDIAEITALRAENERLKDANAQLQEIVNSDTAEEERVRAENERLRAALRKADEELAANGYRDTQWPRPDIRAALEEKP